MAEDLFLLLLIVLSVYGMFAIVAGVAVWAFSGSALFGLLASTGAFATLVIVGGNGGR